MTESWKGRLKNNNQFKKHQTIVKLYCRCIFQLQHLIRNPLVIRSAAPLSASPSNSNTSTMPANNINPTNENNLNHNNNISVNKINNNLLNRNHQNDFLEELTSPFLDSNEYGKQ